MSKKPFHVYHQSEDTNNEKVYYPYTFSVRRKARNFCQKRWLKTKGLHIVHPDGTEELYGKQ